MNKRGRGRKRVSDEWQSSVVTDGRFVYLYKPLDGKMFLSGWKFKAGDKVRVTVELIRRQANG